MAEIEGAAERAVFMDTRAFGEVVSYTPAGGMAAEVPAIFEAPHVAALTGADPGVAASAPVAALFDADLLAPPAAGDSLERAGVTWRVVEARSDGAGLSRLVLEEA